MKNGSHTLINLQSLPEMQRTKCRIQEAVVGRWYWNFDARLEGVRAQGLLQLGARRGDAQLLGRSDGGTEEVRRRQGVRLTGVRLRAVVVKGDTGVPPARVRDDDLSLHGEALCVEDSLLVNSISDVAIGM